VSDNNLLPDVQASVVCEDVRMEINGSQTLVGVINAIIAPQLPIRMLKCCIWTRWCSGEGVFTQRSRIISPDEETVICENTVQFKLNTIEIHATNVHFFSGIQFDQYGFHHVEIYLDEDLRLRYPLAVLRPQQAPAAPPMPG
jgi:hypothetical protein